MSSLKFLNPEGSPPPVGQYSTVAVAAPGSTTVYVAGHLPLSETITPVSNDFREQADFVLSALKRTLEGVGSDFAHICILRAFIVGRDNLAQYRDARIAAYSHEGVSDCPPPATTVLVDGLIGGSLIELEAIAVVNG
jgi:enamine deaminase RidA (YjgF/YER057c/UK114 family)